jgi:hypothetical protein
MHKIGNSMKIKAENNKLETKKCPAIHYNPKQEISIDSGTQSKTYNGISSDKVKR